MNDQKQSLAPYHGVINELINYRFRTLTPIAIVLVLGFNPIDHIIYPKQGMLFLGIRVLESIGIFVLFLLTKNQKMKNRISWLVDIMILMIGAAIASMVFLSDGSSSRYYEGANLVFLGMGVLNPFYWRHMLFVFPAIVGFFELAMLLGHGPFNFINFCFANFFMPSTAFLVGLASKIYSEQHYKTYLSESRLAMLYNQADRLSKTDELTNIHNRRYFMEMLQEKIKAGTGHSPFYLIIFDVDYFKQINDRYGHAIGDEVLVAAIKTVKKNIRSNDFLGRYGGDEFIICLDINNEDEVIRRLAKITSEVRSTNLVYKGETIRVSLSVGGARFEPGRNMDEKQLVELADQQLLHVKKTGRGQIRLAS